MKGRQLRCDARESFSKGVTPSDWEWFGDGGTSPIYLKVNGGAVEFPGRKNTAKKTVNYNGLDNSIALYFLFPTAPVSRPRPLAMPSWPSST